MKKLEAIVRFSKFEEVKEALHDIGVNFFTYSEVYGHGKQKGETISYRGAHYDKGDIPRVKIELVIEDDKVGQVTSSIIENGRTGTIGDGKIIVTNVEAFIRIRTGETNSEAL